MFMRMRSARAWAAPNAPSRVSWRIAMRRGKSLAALDKSEMAFSGPHSSFVSAGSTPWQDGDAPYLPLCGCSRTGNRRFGRAPSVLRKALLHFLNAA
jgi:hypothetical protein